MAYGGSTANGLRSFWCATVPFVKPYELRSTPNDQSKAATVYQIRQNDLPTHCLQHHTAAANQLVGNSPPLTNVFTVGPCVTEFSSQPEKLYWVSDRE